MLTAERAAADDPLNAFLLAAGLRQVVEDELERDVLHLADVARVLAAGHPGLAVGAGRAADVLSAAQRARGPDSARCFEARLGRLVDALAEAVVAGTGSTRALVRDAEGIVESLPAQGLCEASARLPSCFAAFDQHPDDLRLLTERFLTRQPDGDAPVAVVGVRTSGSYMAPLVAGMLRARGRSALAVTVRPGHGVPTKKRRILRRLLHAGGTVLVIDDPPASGGSLATVATTLERWAPRRGAVILLLALFENVLPPLLTGRAAVLLPYDEWTIHARLEPAAVASTLQRWWGAGQIGTVRRLALDDAAGRGHHAARFATGEGEILVRGAGLGYFGDHAVAVAEALGERVPTVYGAADGLVYGAWLAEQDRRVLSTRDAEPVATYVAQRRDRLPAATDASAAMHGQDAVWEVASMLLARAFGRGWRVMRLAVVDRVMRDLTVSSKPSVVDGAMDPTSWFSANAGETLQKIRADVRAFSNRNLACYDAAYDLAAMAASEQIDGEALRAAFARETGETINEERWLVYQLVAHWAARRDGRIGSWQWERASSRSLQRYMATVYLHGRWVGRQEICALDVDGVLETEALGYSGLTPASALSLRALLAHGYLPVLATGRSLPEVRERCAAWGLLGGVAEYGAVVHIAAGDRVETLVDASAAAAVERARRALAARPGVTVGRDHRHVVRAWRRDADGRRTGLSPSDVNAARIAAGAAVLRCVPGESQTDLVPAGVNKGDGLRKLLHALGRPDERQPLAFAVGDGPEDEAMLAMAAMAAMPAHGARELRARGARKTRRSYQAGLAEAVGRLLGHPPGACSVCAPDDPGATAQAVRAILGAREAGRIGLMRAAVRLAWAGRRGRD